MFELLPLLGYILAGFAVGILGGLLPALPVYIGPFLLYTFHTGMNTLEMLAFWLVAFIGGQYFGSVATITTNIPGEESALIYIEDLQGMSLQQKNELLYSTALSSSIATIIAIALMWIFISFVDIASLPFLYSVWFQGLIYILLLASFFLITPKKWYIVLVTVIFGLSVAPHANYALPNWWYNWTWMFEGYTLYLIILGTLILPNIFTYTKDVDTSQSFKPQRTVNFNFINTIKSSLIGFGMGLIPGPSAEVGAATAYRTAGKNINNKIIAAEAANNSAILASVLPFFILAIPVNNNSILMSGIFDLHGLTITEAIKQSTPFFGLSVIDAITILLVPVTIIYYLLSTNLIDMYVKLMLLLHGKIKALLLLIVGALVYVDLQTAEITITHYFILLSVFTAIGFTLKRIGVSAIPLMFSIILGDRLIWAFIQFTKIYL